MTLSLIQGSLSGFFAARRAVTTSLAKQKKLVMSNADSLSLCAIVTEDTAGSKFFLFEDGQCIILISANHGFVQF